MSLQTQGVGPVQGGHHNHLISRHDIAAESLIWRQTTTTRIHKYWIVSTTEYCKHVFKPFYYFTVQVYRDTNLRIQVQQ